MAFWIEQAKQHADPILELGCGTGKITIPLAKQGFRMAGLDLSSAMLTWARQKSGHEGVSVEWIEGDMRDFAIDRKYSLIMLPSNNICHLLSHDDLHHCLACVRNHLQPHGHFIIDVFVPSLSILLRSADEAYTFSEYDDPDGRGKVVVSARSSYETHTQITRTTTFRAIPGEQPREGRLDMRMYFPAELDSLLRYNGFNIVAKYGDYSLTDFNSEAKKQLIVCRVQ
jgi:SAM-dependent methyltransferase